MVNLMNVLEGSRRIAHSFFAHPRHVALHLKEKSEKGEGKSFTNHAGTSAYPPNSMAAVTLSYVGTSKKKDFLVKPTSNFNLTHLR